jgi:hypothetical protein
MRVSSRTLQRWALSPEYHGLFDEMKREWKEQAEGRIHELGHEVIEVMVELMHNEKSVFTRFQAAKALGDWMGLGQTKIEEERDDRNELAALYDQLAARRQELQVNVTVEHINAPDQPRLASGMIIEGEAREV